MSYAGNPDNFPANFPLISDVAPPAGSDLNVPLEALGDRTANLDARVTPVEVLAGFLRSAAALNWKPVVQISDAISCAAWDNFRRRWTVAGNAIFTTANEGYNVDAAGLALGGARAQNIAVDHTTGNVVVATNGRNVARLNASAWALVDVRGAAATERAVVARSSTSFFWFGQDGQIRKSSTGASGTWALVQTLAGGTHTTRSIAVNRTTGTVIASVFDPSTGLTKFARSIDDGVSWTAGTTPILVFPLPESRVSSRLSVATKASGQVWMLSTASDSRSDVHISTNDGLTWTRVFASTTTRVCGQAFAPHGNDGVWVAADAGSQQMIYSADDGATWRYCQYANPNRVSLASDPCPDFVAAGPYGLALALQGTGGSGSFVVGFKLASAGEVAA